MIILIRASVLCALLTTPVLALAQATDGPNTTATLHDTYISSLVSSLKPGPIGSPTSAPGNGFQFSFADGQGTASLSLGGKLPGLDFYQSSAKWTIVAATPLSNSSTGSTSSPTSLATSSGVQNGFSLKPKISWFWLADFNDKSESDLVTQAKANCEKIESSSQCFPDNNLTFVQKYVNPKIQYLGSAGFWTGNFWVFTLQPAFQFSTHTYYQSKTLSKKNDPRGTPGFGAYFSQGKLIQPSSGTGWYPNWHEVTIGDNYSDQLTDNTTMVECLSKPTGSVETCVNGAIGAPKAKISNNISFQFKQAFLPGTGAAQSTITAVSLAPTISYDTSTHIYGIDAPLYISPAATGSVFGGLDFAWQSKPHQFIVGVFVASSFGAF